MTLGDSDRIAYLFQHLEGEAKKAVESLGVTGHTYAAALKILKRLFGNPYRVASAHLKSMIDGPYVSPNDRQALRDYYYQVKACTSWCVKMGQFATLQTPEYLSKGAMRLPMSLRVKWYEHMEHQQDGATLLEFERWLCRRVDTLFNPYEDYIHEELENKKSRSMKPRSNEQINLLNTTIGLPTGDSQYVNKDSEGYGGSKGQSSNDKCVVCPGKHRVAFCSIFKAKPLKERRKVVWDQKLCLNCLKANHQARNCTSSKRCLKRGCGQPHHTLLHKDKESGLESQVGPNSPTDL